MARFDFRHGIARRQKDSAGNPNNLHPSNGGSYIDLIVSPDPTVFICSHYEEDYMVAENATVTQAWGPFTAGTDYWLFWDIDFTSGELTRQFTTLEPEYGPTPPPNPVPDQHWYDTTQDVMRKWIGSAWIDTLRVFAAKYQGGATLIDYPLRSQVGKNGLRRNAGMILFDPDGKPVQKFQRNRRGRFITTETPLHSQFNRIGNFRVEAAITPGEAQEHIPVHHCVAYYDFDQIVLARNTVPDRPVIGLAMEDMFTGEVRSYITKGFVTNEADWDWSQYPVGTPLFCGPAGELIPQNPPTSISFQQVGYIVNRTTVFINISALIELEPPNTLNEASLYIDVTTGTWRTRPGSSGSDDCQDCELGDLENVDTTSAQDGDVLSFNSTTGNWEPIVNTGTTPPPGASRTWGYCHIEAIPSNVWMVAHNLNTECVVAEVYDASGNQVLPDDVSVIDGNNIIIYFKVPMDGRANIVLSV